MTKKDLFRIIIKVFSLYFVVAMIFTTIPQSSILFLNGVDLGSLVILIISIAIIFLILYFLIVKTDIIIRIFRLDKGFDDDNINIEKNSSESIFKISIILLGGIFIINNFGTFITTLSFAFRSMFIPETAANYKFMPDVDFLKLITSAINILLGYLLIRYNSKISMILKIRENDHHEA